MVATVTASFLKELWERRHQILMLSLNDVKMRYRNSVLGFVWSFLEPLLMLTVLYFVFTNIFKGNIKDYPLFILLGLIIWYMFSRSTTMGTTSLKDKSAIISKIYFPREVIVISSCLTAFIMMGFEFIAFGVFMAIFGFVPPITMIYLPLLLVDLFVLSIGISFLLSILNVYFKDIIFIWQILLQVGFFITPIIYNLNNFPANIQKILELNPIATIIDVAHNIVLYNTLPTPTASLYIVGSTAIIFVIGYVVFRLKDKMIVEML